MREYSLYHFNFRIALIFLSGIFFILPARLYPYKKEHLRSLYKQIKIGNGTVQCSNFDLQNANLKRLNLKNADFTQANLKGANFSESNLKGAIFFNAKAQKANFSHSNLKKSNLIYSNLNGANFRYANLSKANFDHATINGAKFKKAQLENAKYKNVYSKKGCFLEDLSNTKTKKNNSLDLHDSVSMKSKSYEIEKFIKSSYKKNFKTVEIITGRGIHNPDKVMGIQWNWCKTYLLNKKFNAYIKGIQSLNKNGCWKVFLKDRSLNRAKTTKSTKLILSDKYSD